MSRKKKVILAIISVLTVLVISGSVYAVKVVTDSRNAVSKMHKEVKGKKELRSESVDLSKLHPFSIVLLGIDTGEEGRTDRGRSDSIMVVTVNPHTKKTTLLSVPRDSYAEIVGYGDESTGTYFDKINHAYAYGGATMSINSIQKFLNVPLDYYATIDMKGIEEIVDAIGGIDVNNKFKFTERGHTYEEGELHLNGKYALNYARMRYSDPEGDYGRQKRQREVIQEIVNQILSVNSLLSYQSLFNSLSKNMATNLTFDQLVSIGENYSVAAKTMNQVQIEGEGEMIDGVYYDKSNPDSLKKATKILRDSLELDDSATSDSTSGQTGLTEEATGTSSTESSSIAASE